MMKPSSVSNAIELGVWAQRHLPKQNGSIVRAFRLKNMIRLVASLMMYVSLALAAVHRIAVWALADTGTIASRAANNTVFIGHPFSSTLAGAQTRYASKPPAATLLALLCRTVPGGISSVMHCLRWRTYPLRANRCSMSIPRKHHYLPQAYLRAWAVNGKLTEYRRFDERLIVKWRTPAQTAYLIDLYANESKSDPLERQALEMGLMQRVDDDAAEALKLLQAAKIDPLTPSMREAWARFILSLMHRTPSRMEYLEGKVRDYERLNLSPTMRDMYASLRQPVDPDTYEEWLEINGTLKDELKVGLVASLIESTRISTILTGMAWGVIMLHEPRFGFLTGDMPLTLSNGLAPPDSFVMLPISPTKLFIAAHKREVINSFATQRPNALERAINDACARQSKHLVIGKNDQQRLFVDRRFQRERQKLSSAGFMTWKAPLGYR